MKKQIKRIQEKLGLCADGIIGPQSISAINRALGIADTPLWPTQAEVRSGRSLFGPAGQEQKLVNIQPPYTRYYRDGPLGSIRVHEAIAPHVQAARREVLAHYGNAEIIRLGLNDYGGSYNLRPTSKGSALSMHAWGIALDFAPAKNGYNCKAPSASLSRPECQAWWDIWEAQGAIPLGRERDYDWMHLQFALLNS